MAVGSGRPVEVLSIGHSNHTSEAFLGLLESVGVEVVVDVRSVPISSFCPHFNQDRIRTTLEEAGVRYVFLGEELGGRPVGDQFYDESDRVRYDVVSESGFFRDGLERLRAGAAKYRVAVMCSEGSPDHCHRHLLISRVLEMEGTSVSHVLPDGSLRAASDLLDAARPEATLFGQEEQPWISTQSVSRSTVPRSSSDS